MPPVFVQTSDGKKADTCTEIVKLTFENPLLYGVLVVHHVPFALRGEKTTTDTDWDIYIRIPVLAHLKVLPTQILGRYTTGSYDVDCFEIPL